MNNFLFRGTLFSCLLLASLCNAQQHDEYNLNMLLKDGKLVSYPGREITALHQGTMDGVSCNGIVWIKGVTFSTGSIDVDIRGKNVQQQSFVGIAFHGIDTITYESIYFRPFNFQSPDAIKQKHQVQYISEPDFPWDRLRKEHPLVYESGVTPAVMPTDWFHAHIVITKEDITVYVNNSSTPSLKVKKLGMLENGMVGLWSSFLNGDFANLEISPPAP